MRVLYPSAEELDTAGCRDDYRVALYLVPGGETEDGVPEVVTHTGVGNIGTPMPAFHHRWLRIGGYGPGTVGESVLSSLREGEDVWLAWSESYLGSEWDGRNLVGSWADTDAVLDYEWDGSELSHYWDAADWFGPAGVDWEDLCEEAGIDPARGLGDDWQDVAAQVAAIVEPRQDERVSGTEDYARDQCEQWREREAEVDADT